jgi:hypothetical protein
MKSITQTRFLSKNYSTLHGLKGVPIGLCLLLISYWANISHYPINNISFPIIIALGSLLLLITIAQYYKRTFGEVKPTFASRRIQWIEQFILGTLAIAAFWTDVTFNLSVNFVGLLFASSFLFDKPRVTLPLNKFSTIKLVLSICIILASISPLYLGVNWWNTIGVRAPIIGVTMLVGILIVIQGTIWHFFFVTSLPTTEAKDE